MTTLVKIGDRTLNVTHICSERSKSDPRYRESHPLMVIDPNGSDGYNVIILRPLYASGNLAIVADAFIPFEYIDAVLAHAVRLNSYEGKRLSLLDSLRG